MQKDQELVQSFEGGNQKSFEILYERYKTPLYRYIIFYTGDPVLAEDLLQKTFLKFVQRVRMLVKKPGLNLKAWLFKVSLNLCRDDFRSAYRKRTDLSDQIEKHHAVRYSDTEEMVRRQNLSRLIDKIIQALPERYRKVMGLYYYSSCTHEEIAGILMIPKGTVKSRLDCSFRRLRQDLKKGGYGTEDLE